MEDTDADLLPPLEDGHIAAFNATEAGLAALREELDGKTFDCTDREQDAEARRARRELVTLRTTIEARRKELKAPLLSRGKLLDDEAKRITGEIIKLERPIDEQIRAEEDRKAAEKAAREEAERAARAQIAAAIDGIRQRPLSLLSANSHAIEQLIAELAIPVALPDDATDADKAQAAAVQETVVTQLREMVGAAMAREAEAERLRQEREALERQRQAREVEQAKLDEARRAEDARIAEERRIEQERIDRENAAERERMNAEAAALRQQQEAAAREREALARKQREEEEKTAAERRATIGLREAAQAVVQWAFSHSHDAEPVMRDLVAALDNEDAKAKPARKKAAA